MSGTSKVTLEGTIDTEITSAYSASGMAWTKFGIVEEIKDFKTREVTLHWWNMTAFRGDAEDLRDKAKKGDYITLTGRPNIRMYNGNPVRDVIINTYSISPPDEEFDPDAIAASLAENA